jgi:hypothetical protein
MHQEVHFFGQNARKEEICEEKLLWRRASGQPANKWKSSQKHTSTNETPSSPKKGLVSVTNVRICYSSSGSERVQEGREVWFGLIEL